LAGADAASGAAVADEAAGAGVGAGVPTAAGAAATGASPYAVGDGAGVTAQPVAIAAMASAASHVRSRTRVQACCDEVGELGGVGTVTLQADS